MRIRISTTVDATSWEKARGLMGVPASQIVDRALEALVDRLEGERELAALEKLPYDQDPAVFWEGDSGPDLPYEGDVPEQILRLAAERKRARSR